jgi:hypothetical protein
MNQRKWSEGERILRECLAVGEKAHPDDLHTFNTRFLLGQVLLARDKYAQAEPLLVQGYEGMKAFETWDPRLKVNLPEWAKRLVRTYETRGRFAEAAAWRKRLGVTNLEGAMPNGMAAFVSGSTDGKGEATP